MKETLALRADFTATREAFETALGVGIRGTPRPIRGVALDTRTLREGDVFFALSSQRDGHDFVEQAWARGAALCVVSRPIAEKIPQIVVGETYLALANLARSHRERWGKRIVAVSGSNGKTTTKEMIRGLLGTRMNVFASPGNWNNHLGVPLCLLSLRDEHDVAVLEMGMNGAGQIEGYCKVALPNVSVLTNIGTAHIGELGSIEAIGDAKAEIFRGLSSDGTAVVLIDDPRIFERAQKIQVGAKIWVSAHRKADVWLEGDVIHYGDRQRALKLPFEGEHMRSNFACALGVAKAFGVEIDEIDAGISQIEWPAMRLTQTKLKGGVLLVDDSYNANPDSLAVALAFVAKHRPGRKIAVLGDMLELGSHGPGAHEASGRLVAKNGFAGLMAVGPLSAHSVAGARNQGLEKATHFDSKEALIAALRRELLPEDVVLVKGSRGSRMDEVVSALLSNPGKEESA